MARDKKLGGEKGKNENGQKIFVLSVCALFFSIGIVLPVVSQEAAATITPFFQRFTRFQ